ncbi:sulfatase-like hydrolase/transferase [Curtanaerobium respiraculi]|uniref:sulfatase-like hydrolase/transferase n=1 Tax=Curtanaerobium respiraculi TaxID=2949669 RepID=UPI0024B35E09|nr:sulfatase-like hydrolase/transferase [Curtanaerobium respiraculi]
MPRSMHAPLTRGGRLALAGLWAGTAFFLAVVWFASVPSVAYAYVDPSVMTYTIQALAGVAVALSALAGVVFRRLRRKIFNVFNIDENANKATEGRIARIAPDGADAPRMFSEADDRARALLEESRGKAGERSIADLTWKKRFGYSLLMSLFAFFIILVAPAMEIIGGNADSLVFSLDKVWWVSALINGALAVACAFALSTLRGKSFLAALLFVFCLTCAAYAQSMFMNAGMMPADGGYIGWDEPYFQEKMLNSGIVWLLILIVPQLLSMKHRYTWLKATSALAVAIIIMQAFGVGSVAVDVAKAVGGRAQPYVTQGDLYTVNPNDNVVVFVLDTYDTALLDDAVADDPHTLDNFTDFTYFRNSLGTMIPTANAVPYMLSGEKPEPGGDVNAYRAVKYESSNYIPTMRELGYSVGVYTDTAMFDYRNPADMAISQMTTNIHPVDQAPVDIWGTYVVMNQCALYREAPWSLKPDFWYYTTDVNNRMVGGSPDSDGDEALYELDDAGILRAMRERGLSATDTADAGAFRFIHLFGPHFPFSVDENGNDVGVANSDQARQARGSLKVVDCYIDELKRLGLYDQATIIVTADHGVWDEREDPVRNAISPIMLVKPSMPDGGEGMPVQVSEMPISHEDIAPTVIQAMGGDPSAFCSGLTVWQVSDPGRIRYFNALTNVGPEGQRMVEYRVEGDALDLHNWSKTGNVWLGA